MRLRWRRVVAMVVALSCHLALLVAVTMPSTYRSGPPTRHDVDENVLELRLVEMKRSVPAMSLPPLPRAANTDAPLRHLPRNKAGSAPPSSNSPVAAQVPEEVPDRGTTPAAPQPQMGSSQNQASSGDGGFRQRLLDAQGTQRIHGVPGSDRRLAPGMQMVNPRDQGVGAVMRATQSLFGITNKHCIDVEVWNSLTDEERAAKPVSPSEMRRQAETYHCNRPLGLTL